MKPLGVSEHPLEATMPKFKDHPKVKLINDNFNNAGASFSFQYVSLDETSKEIDMLNPKKLSQATDIYTKQSC